MKAEEEIEKVYYTSSDIVRETTSLTHYEVHKIATQLGVSYKKNLRGSKLYPQRSVEKIKKHLASTRVKREKKQELKDKLREYNFYKKNIVNKFRKEKSVLTDQKRIIQDKINQLNQEFNELVGDVDRDIRIINMKLNKK